MSTKEADIYNEFVQRLLNEDHDVYVLPKLKSINATLLKRGNHISIYSNHQNKNKYFPDLKDIAKQIDTKNTILQVGILELDMDGKIKDSDNWFYNDRLQPDGVRIVAKDCYYYDSEVILDEPFKKRFERVEEIIPYKEKIGIYEILPLPNERIESNHNPAEFQAMLDWVTNLDTVDSDGAIIRDSSSTVFDEKEKVI